MTVSSDSITRFDDDWHTWQHRELADGSLSAADALTRAQREGDPWLLSLIARAQEGDQVAGRVVLQHLVRLLVWLTVRDERLSVEALAAAVWLRVLAYPVARRPRSVAANLVLDARKHVLAELRPLAQAPTVLPRRVDTARQLLADAFDLGVLREDLWAAMGAVYVEGLTSAEAGAHLGVTPETVRWRCSTGVRRMRQYRSLLSCA